MKQLIERLNKHIKTCQEWKLAGKDYDENTHVPFFCSEVEAEKIIKALEMMESVKKLEFMVENGLGWRDMENDIKYPQEL